MSPVVLVGYALAFAGAFVIVGFAVALVIVVVRAALKAEVKK